MQIHFRPEIESELNRIAVETGCHAEDVVQELVAKVVEQDAWFREQVARGINSLDSGQFVDQEQVAQRLERLLGR